MHGWYALNQKHVGNTRILFRQNLQVENHEVQVATSVIDGNKKAQNLCPYRLMDRTWDFYSQNGGSIPSKGANINLSVV